MSKPFEKGDDHLDDGSFSSYSEQEYEIDLEAGFLEEENETVSASLHHDASRRSDAGGRSAYSSLSSLDFQEIFAMDASGRSDVPPSPTRRKPSKASLPSVEEKRRASTTAHSRSMSRSTRSQVSASTRSARSFGSSWDSQKLFDISGRETSNYARLTTPSRLSTMSKKADNLASFRSLELSNNFDVSLRTYEGDDDEEQDDIDVSIMDDSPIPAPVPEGYTLEPPDRFKPQEFRTQSTLQKYGPIVDDWLKRKIQYVYVLFALYLFPIGIAMYAPLGVVSGLYYTSIVCVVVVNSWMMCEVFSAYSYTHNQRKLHHSRPKIIGERRLGTIIAAYLPNELSVLVDTVLAISKTIHELPEGTTLDIVLSHNGGKQEQRIALLEDLRKLEAELPNNIMVHEVNVLSSRSKAENVNAALAFLDEIGKIRGKSFTQVAMYDADHQPIPQAWRYALETMQDQKADMVMGRCCVQDGLKYIAIEFDVIYAVAHAGGRGVRGFGFFGGSNGYWDFPTLLETGMDEGMLTEDVDSSFRAQAAGHVMTYDPTIVSYEESPPDFQALFKQRLRWAQGWYEVTLRQFTLPFRPAPGLTIWSRICIFMLLQFREAYVYLSSFTIPIAVVWLTRACQWTCVDYRLLGLAAFCLQIPIVMTFSAWYLTKDRFIDVHYRMPTLTAKDYFRYLLIVFPYELFKIHVTVMGHIRQVMKLNKWVVTKRKGTANANAKPPAPPPAALMANPEMLLDESPFAPPVRKMFAGTFDEKRPQRVVHGVTEHTNKLKEEEASKRRPSNSHKRSRSNNSSGLFRMFNLSSSEKKNFNSN